MTAMGKIGGAQARETTTLVELLVWTYQRQKADIMSGRGLWKAEAEAMDEEPLHGWSTCGCAKIEAIGNLGCEIDGGGWQRPALHADAELVHDQVVAMSSMDWVGAMLLRRYGRQGGMPDWVRQQQLEPVLFGGKPDVREAERVVVVYPNRERRVVPVTYCPVAMYPDDSFVDLCRAEYAAWFKALTMLGRWLDGKALVRWEIAGPGAVAEPWKLSA